MMGIAVSNLDCGYENSSDIQKRPRRTRAQAKAATAAPPRWADPEIWLSFCRDQTGFMNL